MENLCKCGCGGVARKTFISGHNLKGMKRTPERYEKIGAAQKAAWARSPNRLCFGRNPRRSVGSTWIDPHGYVLIKDRDDCKHWRRQHILIMEEEIGRKLKKEEIVHHINGVRSDNRIENLLLCSTMSEHNNIEATWKAILRGLMEDGIVGFNYQKRVYERFK